MDNKLNQSNISENEIERPLRQEQRLDGITELVLASGTVKIEDLVEQFQVSGMTIHRDLDLLDSRGILRKSRGYATAIASSLFEANPEYRQRQNIFEKEMLAQTAFKLVEPGQSLILDDSTTVIHLAKLLVQKQPLTVITNFQKTVDVLKNAPGISVVSLGGHYYQWSDAYMGAMTVNSLRSIRADMLFMSTPSIIDEICFHQHHEAALVKQAMFESAGKRYLLADHSKFEQRAVHSTIKLENFDGVILDSLVSAKHVEHLRLKDINVIPSGNDLPFQA
jgi:DeoR/GlpR family transcriptional regulator of sugar metabolism